MASSAAGSRRAASASPTCSTPATQFGIQLDAIDQERWVDIERDSILVVAPPPHASQPQRRVHRQRRRVRARVGPFEITGTAHLVPGAGLDPYLLRTRQAFLPMTGVVHLTPRQSRLGA